MGNSSSPNGPEVQPTGQRCSRALRKAASKRPAADATGLAECFPTATVIDDNRATTWEFGPAGALHYKLLPLLEGRSHPQLLFPILRSHCPEVLRVARA